MKKTNDNSVVCRRATRGLSSGRTLLPDMRGSQLVEFALALPFLLVMVVGIIDFGGAYALKQKLNNAAREGARFAAGENTLDLNCGSCSPAPDSVTAVRDVVTNYLTNAGVTTCTVGTSSTYSSTNQAWTYASTSSGCGSFSLKIERGYTFASGGTTAVASRVTLAYPYTWTLGRIIGLLVSGGSLSLPTTITSDAIMQNLP